MREFLKLIEVGVKKVQLEKALGEEGTRFWCYYHLDKKFPELKLLKPGNLDFDVPVKTLEHLLKTGDASEVRSYLIPNRAKIMKREQIERVAENHPNEWVRKTCKAILENNLDRLR